MNFSINAKAFKNAVITVAKNIPSKTVLPYGLITVKADADKVTVSSMEPHSFMSAEIQDVTVNETGEVSLNSAKLYALMKEIDALSFDITDKGPQVSIRSENGNTFHISAYREQIPSWMKESMPVELKFEGNEFIDIINKTAAICRDVKLVDDAEVMNNPYFGFNLSVQGTTLKLQSVIPDRSVAARYLKVLDAPAGDCSIIIPYSFIKTVGEIKNDGDTFIRIGSKTIEIVKGDIVLKSVLYPKNKGFSDVDRIIPKNFSSEISVDRKAIVNAVKICNIAESNSLDIDVDKQKRQIALHASDELTQLDQSIGCLIEKQADTRIGTKLKGKNLIKVLSAFGCEEIQLQLNGKAPCVIRDEEDDHYVFVIAPLLRR